MNAKTTLTDQMRVATRKIHSISDKLVNLKLLVALTNPELYGRALLLFYYIYVQLEISIQACKDHEAMRGLNEIFADFARADGIAKDLQHYLGEDWKTRFQPTPEVQAYITHLKELEKKNPTLLVPYCYHMYMAMLAGGQIISKMVQKSFSLPAGGAGLQAFQFPVKSRMALRSMFKDKINAVPYDEETKKLMLAESIRCFQMNNKVVRSLDGSGRQLLSWMFKWTIVVVIFYVQEGEPPFRGDYPPPPMDYRGGPMHFPDHGRPYVNDYKFRGRRRSEGRGEGGYNDMGGGGGRFSRGRGGRSRSRSPPGGRHPPPRPGGGDWERHDDNRKDRKLSSSIEPMDSYKVFMMRQDENSTPETYQQRYEEYKKKYLQRLMRAFFEEHKREEWLQERYSPAINYRLEQQKNAKKLTAAKNFGERVRNGTAKICLDEGANLGNNDFDNDMEHSSRILYIRRIPCACPVSSLSESVKKAGGSFQHIYLSDPVKKSAFDFDRSAYIIYETPEAAAEALPKIHNTFVQDADIFAPFRLQVSQHRSRAPLKTPSYLSVPERLTFDFKQASRLATALDRRLFTKEADLTNHGIEALLEQEEVATVYQSDKQKLDVVIAYLRRVHHYIYYAGVQCIDMGDIMHAHPALFCRPEPTTRDLEEEKARQESAATGGENSETSEAKASIGGWAAALDEKVEAYIKELEPDAVAEKREKQRVLVEDIEAKEEEALESTYANYGEKAGDDGKHRCRLCTKLFKAMDFVKKHIRNKHPELVVDKIAEVGESYMWEQYREDPNRPIPPIETTNNLSNPVLGGRGGNNGVNGSPYRGGGGPPRSYGGGQAGGRGFYRNDGPPGYRGRGPPPPFQRGDRSPRRGPPPPRSPPRSNRPPEGDLPVDPRQITKSYQDLDNLQDTKVELSFDALDSLPPPKKKSKI